MKTIYYKNNGVFFYATGKNPKAKGKKVTKEEFDANAEELQIPKVEVMLADGASEDVIKEYFDGDLGERLLKKAKKPKKVVKKKDA